MGLLDGIVTGIFNTSSNIFYGFSVYSKTQNPAQIGLYNITLDTMGLNATTYLGMNNYNLTLTVSVPQYQSISLNISCPINPIPTQSKCFPPK